MNTIKRETIEQGTKFLSIAISLFLIFSGIFGIFSITFDIKTFILDIYICIFGVIILTGEFGKLKNYFGFAHSFLGRGIFQIFIGLTLVLFDWEESSYSLEYVAGVLILIIGSVDIILSCYCMKKNEDIVTKNEKQTKSTKEEDSLENKNDLEMQSI